MDDIDTEGSKHGRRPRMGLTLMMQPMATYPPENAVRFNVGRALGFTMIEMLMAIAVAAILMTIAIPSFRYITNANRIASELNGLLGDLQLARAEAIKEGRTVTVCQSTDSLTCTNGVNWEGGWIVFSDPADVGVYDVGETYIRKQKPFSGTDTFVASNNVSVISFNREGYAIGIANGTVLTLHDSSNNGNWTRCLAVNLSGQMTSVMLGTTNGITCT